MKISEISKIKLDPNDKLVVRLPDGTTAEEEEVVRNSLLKFFGITPNRLLIYQGDVDFQVVS